MANVVLENLSKMFRRASGEEVYAVKHASFVVSDKEFLVLVGPSGCGKSTTLRMIAGLEEISEGTISIDGKVVNDVPAKDRDIAMVFQNYALYPHMTVYENMAFGLKLRKFARSGDRRTC
jgi:multiple sugar transport system ATP-binding protein